MIAQIAVAAAVYAIDKPYSYAVPEGWTVCPGQRVQVSFGKGRRTCEGIVLSVSEGSPEGLKPIGALLEDTPALDSYFLRLASFLRERYFCTFYDAARVLLPAGLWFRQKNLISLTDDRSWQEKAPRKAGALELLKQLEALGGAGDEAELAKDRENAEELFAYLLRKKWIAAQQDFQRKISDKTEKIVTLAVSPEEARAFTERTRTSALQRSVLELLLGVGTGAVKDVCYYTGAGASVVRRLAELGLVTLSERTVFRCREVVPAKIDGELRLNEEQEAAFQGLCAQMQRDTPGTALLYGITGSGKTAVFIRLIQTTLEAGRGAMLLVPEISLTPQLLGLMAAYFGTGVAVLHSALNAGERCDQWKRIRSGEAKLAVGTRSAIFAPVRNLGLIILDEEQERSYQSENNPRYHAREVALWRGLHEKALVLLGSATPSVESMFHAQKGDFTLYTMKNRFNGRMLPGVEIVDMKEELRLGNDLSLSLPLRDAIDKTRADGKQTVLLMNRRGNSRALVCIECREAPQCPRCSQSLTYHSANDRLMCHYCGFSQLAPRRCPACGGPLKPVGVGIQRVENELLELTPDMRLARMDTDTVSAVNTHEKILETFRKEHQDVLLGTQMVAKGLNLPLVTLVGVLDADLGLYGGGYRAAETTFDMLTQVVGRAGRGESPGKAILQTMAPDNRVIRLAAAQDYMGFYRMEIEMRRILNAPPFSEQLQVMFTSEVEGEALRCAIKFRDSLILLLQSPTYCQIPCRVLGPAPCPIPKINYSYRFQLTLNGHFDRNARQLLAHLLRQAGKDKENRKVTVFMDVNGDG